MGLGLGSGEFGGRVRVRSGEGCARSTCRPAALVKAICGPTEPLDPLPLAGPLFDERILWVIYRPIHCQDLGAIIGRDFRLGEATDAPQLLAPARGGGHVVRTPPLPLTVSLS